MTSTTTRSELSARVVAWKSLSTSLRAKRGAGDERTHPRSLCAASGEFPNLAVSDLPTLGLRSGDRPDAGTEGVDRPAVGRGHVGGDYAVSDDPRARTWAGANSGVARFSGAQHPHVRPHRRGPRWHLVSWLVRP